MSSFAGLPRADQPVEAGAVVLGAEALREASSLLRPWHPTLGVDVLAGAVDGGDPAVEPWLEAGAVPVVVGGESLRALAARHGPLALLALDAQPEADRLAEWLRDDLVDPDRSLVAGVRGPLPEPEELDAVRDRGVELLTGDELRALGPGEYSQRVLARTAAAARACCGSTSTSWTPPSRPPCAPRRWPACCPHEAITLLRSLAGTPVRRASS